MSIPTNHDTRSAALSATEVSGMARGPTHIPDQKFETHDQSCRPMFRVDVFPVVTYESLPALIVSQGACLAHNGGKLKSERT